MYLSKGHDNNLTIRFCNYIQTLNKSIQLLNCHSEESRSDSNQIKTTGDFRRPDELIRA